MKFVHTCPLTKKETIITGDLIKETNTTYILSNAIVRGEKKEVYSFPKSLYKIKKLKLKKLEYFNHLKHKK